MIGDLLMRRQRAMCLLEFLNEVENPLLFGRKFRHTVYLDSIPPIPGVNPLFDVSIQSLHPKELNRRRKIGAERETAGGGQQGVRQRQPVREVGGSLHAVRLAGNGLPSQHHVLVAAVKRGQRERLRERIVEYHQHWQMVGGDYVIVAVEIRRHGIEQISPENLAALNVRQQERVRENVVVPAVESVGTLNRVRERAERERIERRGEPQNNKRSNSLNSKETH